MNNQEYNWDRRRDREVRQTLDELRTLDENGYFEGLNPQAEIPDDLYYDDVHGRPDWRRHLTGLFAEEIRAELSGEAA